MISHNNTIIDIENDQKFMDVTKTRNGMINEMMHGMGKFHGKAALLIKLCSTSVNTDMPLRMALLFT